jgi:hypothetical protein
MIARDLHQIEVTTRCQLSCAYCLQPTLTRPIQDMTRETWLAALDWLRFFVRHGTQGEVVLFGTGEPLLHPDLVQMATEARAVLGPARRMLVTTNGLLVTDALIAALQPINARVYVSLHQFAKATPAVHKLFRAGLLEGVSIDPVTGSNSWAGQVDWPNIMPMGDARPPCPWQQAGWLFMSADGGLYPCCYANGDMPRQGEATDVPHEFDVVTPPICGACWQRTPEHVDGPFVRLSR